MFVQKMMLVFIMYFAYKVRMQYTMVSIQSKLYRPQNIKGNNSYYDDKN